MVDPDTAQVILNNSANNGISFMEAYSMVIDFLTVAAVFLGLYLGNRGLQKYLLKDAVKKRVNNLQDANDGVKDLTGEIIQEIDDLKEIKRPIKEEDLNHVTSLAKSLNNKSVESSTQVRTLSFFLYQSILDIKPKIEKDNYSEVRFTNHFYPLVFNACAKINYYASNIIEIPEEIGVETQYELPEKRREYLSSSGFKKLKDIEHGLNLNPNSEIALIFSKLINRSTNHYVFKKNFFQVLESNIPIVHELDSAKIYFPPILESDDDSIMGESKELMLVKFQHYTSMMDGKPDTVRFYYSNLSPRLEFVDNVDFDRLSNKFNDSFIETENFRSNYIIDQEIPPIGNETIKLTCKIEDLKKYYTDVKRKFKTNLESLKENA